MQILMNVPMRAYVEAMVSVTTLLGHSIASVTGATQIPLQAMIALVRVIDSQCLLIQDLGTFPTCLSRL